MAVRFVIGRAGTGKTHRGFRAIVDAAARDPLGPPIFWIVPKQATFMAERELTCASELGGFCRVRVASFEQLGEDILAECGGGAVPQVSAAGRQMVLGHLLRAHAGKLQFFNSVARQAGLAAELDATFTEFERCGKDAGDLKILLADLEANANDPQAKSLLAKFRDLHLLYEAYSNYLGQDRLDPHRRLRQVLESVENCKSIQSGAIYVDGFYEFTDFERRMLAGIAKVCAQMEISLLLDSASAVVRDAHAIPEELNLFHRTEQTYRKLYFTFQKEGVAIDPPMLLKETHRFSNAYLSHAEKSLFAARPSPAKHSSGVEMIIAPDARSEVDAAARQIRQWLLNGLRLRDIAVLARTLDDYAELIDASFREHSIAYFVDRRRLAAHHPLPQVVRAIFLIALHRWPHDAMMTLLKSGLCGIALADADKLENYVLMHRIRGDEWASVEPWRYIRKLTRDSEADLPPADAFELVRIDELRRSVVDLLSPFIVKITAATTLTVRQYIAELFAVLERFDVRATLLDWINGDTEPEERGQEPSLVHKRPKDLPDREEQSEHEQVWSEFAKLLDQMADVMGDEVVSPADFLTILESGLEQFDLALTPPAIDRVLVGGVERTRTPAVRAAIVLGLNESAFPRTPRDETIFSDGERRALSQRKLEIDPGTQRRLLDENFLGYIAFTRGSEFLVAARHSADDAGRPTSPSPFWKRLRATFPDAPVREIHRDDISADTIGTPRQLVTRLMRWARDGNEAPNATFSPRAHAGPSANSLRMDAGAKQITADDGATWRYLYNWLASHECCDDAIDVMRYRAWRALSYDNQASLSPEISAKLFPSPLSASVSRIETFATCPFKHFARYGLILSEREDAEVSQLDLGNVYHGILEQLVRDMVLNHKTWGADPKNITDAAINKFAHAIGETLRGELMLSSARNQYLLSHIERTLGQVIDSQSAAAARGGFKPLRAELEFGAASPESLPPLELTTPGGKKLRLRGKIDRVDLLEDRAAVAVIDYKLSGSQLSLDRVYHGISLQLLTYMLVLQASGDKLAGKKLTPAAAFYVKLLRQLDDVKHPSEASSPSDETFHLSVKPRGLIHRDFLSSIDRTIAPGVRSDVVQAAMKKDGGLGFRRNSDAAEAHEFDALLKHVEKRLGELGDQIIGGRIDIQPFRMNMLTPCPSCEYRAVCRFDTLTNRYNHLTVLGREGVLNKLTQEARDGR